MSDLCLAQCIMKSQAEQFREELQEFLKTKTDDHFGFNKEQVENIETSINYLVDLISELECEDLEDCEV